jgi:peptidoglycan/LPS O-acetylase OafA/YrhL
MKKITILRLLSFVMLAGVFWSAPRGLAVGIAYVPYLIFVFMFLSTIFGYRYLGHRMRSFWLAATVCMALAVLLSFVLYGAGYGTLLFPVSNLVFCSLYLYILNLPGESYWKKRRG